MVNNSLFTKSNSLDRQGLKVVFLKTAVVSCLFGKGFTVVFSEKVWQ